MIEKFNETHEVFQSQNKPVYNFQNSGVTQPPYIDLMQMGIFNTHQPILSKLLASRPQNNDSNGNFASDQNIFKQP